MTKRKSNVKNFLLEKTVPKSSKSEVAMLPYLDNTFLMVAKKEKKKEKKRGFKKILLFSCG
jgi:hypothetical protein